MLICHWLLGNALRQVFREKWFVGGCCPGLRPGVASHAGSREPSKNAIPSLGSQAMWVTGNVAGALERVCLRHSCTTFYNILQLFTTFSNILQLSIWMLYHWMDHSKHPETFAHTHTRTQKEKGNFNRENGHKRWATKFSDKSMLRHMFCLPICQTNEGPLWLRKRESLRRTRGNHRVGLRESEAKMFGGISLGSDFWVGTRWGPSQL